MCAPPLALRGVVAGKLGTEAELVGLQTLSAAISILSCAGVCRAPYLLSTSPASFVTSQSLPLGSVAF